MNGDEDDGLACIADAHFQSCGITRKQASFACTSYANLSLWISSSICLICFNKYLLSAFPFPATLTLWHMLFCSSISAFLVKTKRVEVVTIGKDAYLRGVLPVACLFSVSLYLNNLAYRFLSVAMLQIIKACTPTVVYLTGVCFGVEIFMRNTIVLMLIICYGIAIASYGDLAFNSLGIIVQLVAVFAEGVRIVLIQVLLQSRGIKLNPIATMYYVLPACALFLLPVWYTQEASYLTREAIQAFSPALYVANGLNAFLLNYAVFLVIGGTSALTMNVAGVVKDWMLIFLSYWCFSDPLTYTTLGGYAIAFCGVGYYNYIKLSAMQSETVKKDDVKVEAVVELESPQVQTLETKP